MQESSRAGKDAGSAAAEEELLVSGLKTYFNRSCRLLLLYPQERATSEAVRNCTSFPSHMNSIIRFRVGVGFEPEHTDESGAHH